MTVDQMMMDYAEFLMARVIFPLAVVALTLLPLLSVLALIVAGVKAVMCRLGGKAKVAGKTDKNRNGKCPANTMDAPEESSHHWLSGRIEIDVKTRTFIVEYMDWGIGTNGTSIWITYRVTSIGRGQTRIPPMIMAFQRGIGLQRTSQPEYVLLHGASIDLTAEFELRDRDSPIVFQIDRNLLE
ncbi:hypothetical protein COO72_02535 [Bifidobacterium callitrichos]|nr:hypothetical protein COO72_02535 [Bifidobacterium callitrichos]